MFCIPNMSWLHRYMFVKANQMQHLKSVHFTGCKSDLMHTHMHIYTNSKTLFWLPIPSHPVSQHVEL